MTADPQDYIKLGYKVTHMFLTKNPHLYYIQEDLEQEALLAVCEAAKKFKDTGKVKFTTYCAKEAHNRILDFLRNSENKYRTLAPVSLEDLVTPESDDSDALSWEEMIGGTLVVPEDCIKRLPREGQLYISMVAQGLTKREIREAMGCSWEYLEELIECTISDLRETVV